MVGKKFPWSTINLALFVLSVMALHSSANAQTVKSGVQKMSGWQHCTVCAGPNAAGPVAQYSMTQYQSSPSLSGGSARFFLGGNTPYSDALWWKQLGASNSKTHFTYDLYFYLKTPQYAQALEFDANQSNAQRKFIFGTECTIKSGVWRVWDGKYATWRSTGIPCHAPSAYKWHHLTWEFYRDGTYVHFVALTLDGVKHYVNRAYAARASGAQEVNVAFQMDGDSAQHDYYTWLDNVKLTYW